MDADHVEAHRRGRRLQRTRAERDVARDHLHVAGVGNAGGREDEQAGCEDWVTHRARMISGPAAADLEADDLELHLGGSVKTGCVYQPLVPLA